MNEDVLKKAESITGNKVEKIFDTSAKLSTEEIQSLYDKYKVQIKEILDIDNLFDYKLFMSISCYTHKKI